MLQGKQARPVHGALAGPQAAAPSQPRTDTASNSSAVAVEHQSSLLVPHRDPVRPGCVLESPAVAESEADSRNSGQLSDKAVASNWISTAAQNTVSTNVPAAGTKGQGTTNTTPLAGQSAVRNSPSSRASAEAKSVSTLPPVPSPHCSRASEPQAPGSQPGTPSWQRAPGGQPPTPISSHPIADELTADSDSAASSSDAPLSRQPLFLQTQANSSAHCGLAAACQRPCQADSTAQPHHTEQTTAATASAYSTAVSNVQGNTARPASLDASAVLLDFGDVDGDRINLCIREADSNPAFAKACCRLSTIQHRTCCS